MNLRATTMGLSIVGILLIVGCLASFSLNAASASQAGPTPSPITGYSPNVQLLNQSLTVSQGHSLRIVFSVVPQHNENLYVYVDQQGSGIPPITVMEESRNGTLPSGVSISMPLGNSIGVSTEKVIIPIIISANSAGVSVAKLQAIFFQAESTSSGPEGGSGTVIPLNVEVTG